MNAYWSSGDITPLILTSALDVREMCADTTILEKDTEWLPLKHMTLDDNKTLSYYPCIQAPRH
jgi:hypothetical protein